MIYQIIKDGLVNTWPTLVIVSVMLITIRFFYHQRENDKIVLYKEFWMLLSILYLILLYSLVTNSETNSFSGYNIIPFREILRYEIGSRKFYFNVIGNIGLFVPFGVIVSSFVKPRKIWPSICIGMIVSTTIEFVQLNIGRSFDIDDIMLNTVGCFIGFLIYVMIKSVIRYLPKFMKSDWFNNLLCIVIAILIILYVVNFKGVSLGL